MVYVTPGDLGWRPCFASWKDSYISKHLAGEKLQFLVDLFETFVDLAFEKLASHKAAEVMPTTPSQNVKCLCNFIEAFIKNDKI
jgi:hypothetical protein